jgi:hypothetical protein
MPSFICVTCGTQHAESAEPPARCAICDDERQYVGAHGQQWTTLDALAEAYEVQVREEEPGLFSVEMHPTFAIGQRALLVQHPAGNVLWDCIALVDDESCEAIEALGGISTIAISHPHYYATFVEWSRAFGGVPVYLHQADSIHVMRPDPCVTFWAGDTHPIGDGLTLLRVGGHFEGSTLLHWATGAEGKGALLVGDTVKVNPDRATVSVMRSYPNLIPVGRSAIWRVKEMLAPVAYDRLYGAWTGDVISSDGKPRVDRSLDRYVQRIAE